MSDLDQDRKRLTIRQRDGVTVYCASAWPGRGEITTTLITSAIIAGLLAGLLLLFGEASRSFGEVFHGKTWLTRIVRFAFLGSLDLSFVLVLALLVLWLPYWLVYQLSPKEFWLEDGLLCHTVRLLGLIRRTRKIAFGRVMRIEIAPSVSVFHLKAVYELKLPRLIHLVAAYWNEKLTTWPLTLVNGIPTRREAEQIQFQLLEVMTKCKPKARA